MLINGRVIVGVSITEINTMTRGILEREEFISAYSLWSIFQEGNGRNSRQEHGGRN